MSVYVHVKSSKIGAAFVGPFVNAAAAVSAVNDLEDRGCKVEIVTPIRFGRWLNLVTVRPTEPKPGKERGGE